MYIAAGSMEVGMGIHGERGLIQLPLESTSQVIKRLLDVILSTDKERDYFWVEGISLSTEQVVVLVNNLGGSTPMELYLAINDIHTQLQSRNMNIQRLYVGEFMSALDMKGLSVTVMRVREERVLNWLDAETFTAGWVSIKQFNTECYIYVLQ